MENVLIVFYIVITGTGIVPTPYPTWDNCSTARQVFVDNYNGNGQVNGIAPPPITCIPAGDIEKAMVAAKG